jgi:hypothetical protein
VLLLDLHIPEAMLDPVDFHPVLRLVAVALFNRTSRAEDTLISITRILQCKFLLVEPMITADPTMIDEDPAMDLHPLRLQDTTIAATTMDRLHPWYAVHRLAEAMIIRITGVRPLLHNPMEDLIHVVDFQVDLVDMVVVSSILVWNTIQEKKDMEDLLLETPTVPLVAPCRPPLIAASRKRLESSLWEPPPIGK